MKGDGVEAGLGMGMGRIDRRGVPSPGSQALLAGEARSSLD